MLAVRCFPCHIRDLGVYFSVKTANGVIAIYIVHVCAYHVIAKKNRLNPSIIHECVYLRVRPFFALFSICACAHSMPSIYHIYHVEFTLRLDVHKWRCKWISILQTQEMENQIALLPAFFSLYMCRAHTAIPIAQRYSLALAFIQLDVLRQCSCSCTNTHTQRQTNRQIDRQADR